MRTASVTRAGGAGPRREELTPWSIRIADVSTGAGREVWHADKAPGSIHHPMAASDQDLLGADGDRLAFAWEKTGVDWSLLGFRRRWSAVELTPGAFVRSRTFR